FNSKTEALARGFRSAAVFPFRLGEKRRAIFVLYRDRPDSFADEVSVLGNLADNISFAIQSAETERERQRLFTALNEREAMLRIAGRAARLGGWSVDLARQRIVWSDEVCTIHEMPPNTSPTFDEALAFYAPEWREMVRARFEANVRDGTPIDFEAEIVT